MAQGTKSPEAARLLGNAPRLVENWVHRFEQQCLAGLSEGEHSGRPSRLDEKQVKEINRILRAKPSNVGMRVNLWNGKTLSAWIDKACQTITAYSKAQSSRSALQDPIWGSRDAERSVGSGYSDQRKIVSNSVTEAELLFTSFVGDGRPPESLVRRYTATLRALEIPNHHLTSALVAAGVRLASAEYALRLRDPGNGLTRRALIVATLAESTSDELTQAAPLRAWLSLCAAPFTAAWHYIVGAAQLWWYDR